MSLLEIVLGSLESHATWLLFSSVGVFGLFLFIYRYAVNNFKPKHLYPERVRAGRSGRGERGSDELEDPAFQIEPVASHNPMTARELGIAEFGDVGALSDEEQRRIKLREHVHNFVESKPEEAASIVRSWLSS